MIPPLPRHDFTEHDLEELNVMATPDNAEDGYILEVVLEYRTELYELHSDYPLVPEKMRVTLNILYPYCQQLVQDLNLDGAPVPKLVPNLCDRMHYILRYCNLKHDLDLGMKLTMIHRALGFVQSMWLKSSLISIQKKNKHPVTLKKISLKL